MRHLLSIIVALLSAAFFCFYIPFITYIGNQDEFSFDGIQLTVAMLPWFAIVFAVVLFTLLIAEKTLPVVESIWFGRWRVAVSPLHVLLVGVLIALWLEGAILSRGLPSLSGIPGTFVSRGRINSSVAVWAITLGVTMFFWRFHAARSHFVLLALPVVLAASLGDAWLGRKPANAEETNAEHVTKTEVLANLSFHRRDNVIVIVPDAFSTDMAVQVLEENPDIGEEMEGFTLFRNNLAAGGQTSWAMPAILQGTAYRGGDFSVFAKEAMEGSAALGRAQRSKGRNVYISSLFPRYCAMLTDKRLWTKLSSGMTPELYHQLGFRFIPYPLKKHLIPTLAAQDLFRPPGATAGTKNGNDAHFFDSFLIPSLRNSSFSPTFHFHHYFGVHMPFLSNAEGNRVEHIDQYSAKGYRQQGEKELRDYVAFLRHLRQTGMYDDATLVLMADHGLHVIPGRGAFSAFELPLFAVKPPRAKERLRYSDVPFSSTYLPAMLEALRESPERFDAFLNNLPKTRFIFQQPDKLFQVDGVDIATAQKTPVPIDGAQTPTPLQPGVCYTFNRNQMTLPLAVPLDMHCINLAGGTGLDAINNAGSRFSLLVKTRKPEVDLNLVLYMFRDYMGDPAGPDSSSYLRITDANRNAVLHDQNYPLLSTREILLKGVSVDARNAVRLSFQFSDQTILVLTRIQCGE